MADTTAERKTVVNAGSLTVSAKREVKSTDQKTPEFVKGNVLNKYRSYTYNFTLAALPKDLLKNPKAYRTKGYNFDFVILKSGGKGKDAINAKASAGLTVTKTFQGENELGNISLTENNLKLGQELVEKFNQSSPGRFDMYIDDVEIETLMAFTPGTNTSFANKIHFSVLEPFSINGFPEALHVGAVSAGYLNYIQASFVLVMEFIGYPDNVDLPTPEPIEHTKRYFVLKLNGFQAEVSEQGTKYRVTCVPYHESAMGNANVLKEPIQMKGNYVKDILKNFEESLNEQLKNSDQKYKGKGNTLIYDKYEIRFADIENNILDKEKNTNIFAESKVLELSKEKSLYRFPDPGNSQQVADNQQRSSNANYGTRDDPRQGRSYSGNVDGQRANNTGSKPVGNKPRESTNSGYWLYTPDEVVVQFPEGSRIHECLAAVLRDSQYTRSILENMDKSGTKDENDMVTYFAILTETEAGEIDPVTNKQQQVFRYIIVPHKIHFTRIPGYQSQKYDTQKLQSKVIRDYKYLYSGSNQDLINFKLNFNTLFFESIPKALGNADYLFSNDALGKENENKPVLTADNIDNVKRDSVGTSPIQVNPETQKVSNIGTAGPLSVNPFDVMTRQMHEAIINSKASLLTGEIEILGDPLFLTTSGQGNHNPQFQTADTTLTVDGEVSYQLREVHVGITFQNPVDIGQDGLYEFQKERIPFSGVYRVNTVKSFFNQGLFKQTLSVMRMPGQFVNKGIVVATDPAEKMEFEPDPYNRIVTDTSRRIPNSAATGQTINLLSQLGTLVSGITGAVGGVVSGVTGALTSAVTDVTTKINSVTAGVTSEVAALSSKLGITASQLQSASPLVLAQFALLAKSLPSDVDPAAAAKQGVATQYIPVAKYTNLPPIAPASKAPDVEVNTADIENLMKVGGAAALALAYGVNSTDKISSAMINKSQTQNLLAVSPGIQNPLSLINRQGSAADTTAAADKKLVQANLVSNSKEVNLKVSNSLLAASLIPAATVVHGSKIESPLGKFVNRDTA